MTKYDDGSSWANQAREELLRLAIADAHGLLILDALWDSSMSETPLDIPFLRAHCAEPVNDFKGTDMDVLLVNLRNYIRYWETGMDDSGNKLDEQEIQDLEKAILGGLHSLRTGRFPCWTCLDTGWHLGLVESREPSWTECKRHHEISMHRIVAPRGPLLRAVS